LNLSNTVQIITIITFTAGLVKYIIVNPLQVAIDALKDTIVELKMTLTQIDCEQKGIDKRLVAVEESSKVAHKRIDALEAKK